MFIDGNYVFGRLNQNLSIDQRVVVGRTSNPDLDGMFGSIVGSSFNGLFRTYIVLLDRPYLEQKAIAITEACLCPVD